MNHDNEAAARLSQAVHEIEVLLHPATVRAVESRTAQPPASAPVEPGMNRFCAIVFAVAIINFVAFMIGSAALGGDALNGTSEGGLYYVSDHGKRTEVSAAAFTYSRLHGFSLLITHPLAMFCAILRRGQKNSRRDK